MKIKCSLFLAVSLALTSCGGMTLKRSSGNKLFDMSGFEGNKRAPLYNKKYIKLAKQNVKNIPEDELTEVAEETENPELDNMRMYKDMLEAKEKTNKNKRKKLKEKIELVETKNNNFDNNLIRSRISLSELDEIKTKEELKKEIQEVKQLLADTKEEIAQLRAEKHSQKQSNNVEENIHKAIENELKALNESDKSKDLNKKTHPLKKNKTKSKKENKKIVKKARVEPVTGAISTPVT